jgi:hypothetical protein
MEAYVRRLQEQDKPVDIHWYDASHAGNDVEQAIEHQEMALRLVARTVGDASIQNRLAINTRNPNVFFIINWYLKT